MVNCGQPSATGAAHPLKREFGGTFLWPLQEVSRTPEPVNRTECLSHGESLVTIWQINY